MLLQFNFKNFKSFRDDATLDLTSTRMSDLSNHVVNVGDEKILPFAVIYGANASGKSNVVEAFRYMRNYVRDSLNYGGETSRSKAESSFIPPTPFLFDADSKEAESSFEVYFITPEEEGAKTYNYGFTVNHDGIKEEWLYRKAKSARNATKVFYRNSAQLELPKISSKQHENLRIALEKETLVVSLGAKLKIDRLKQIQEWFLNNSVADFGKPDESFAISRLLPFGFSQNEQVQNDVVRFLSSFDSSIIGFQVTEQEGSDSSMPRRVSVETVHQMVDSDATATIPLKLESAGTLKMFSLYPFLQGVLETGGVLVVDELNARLHPLLVRAFLLFFLDPTSNPKHAQLIFTTHDAWLLDSDTLRRDEIWFAQKDQRGVSTLYSLADFVDKDGAKIRKDANYEKNYLLGKYGAIPTLHPLAGIRGN